jgi:hypothetical protein
MIWRCETRVLKLIVDILKDILLQVWFVFESDGTIFMMNTDDEKIVTISMFLFPSSTQFTCRHRVVFSFYIQNLFKILRGAPKNSETVLAVYNDSPDTMLIRWNDEPYPAFHLRHLPDEQPQFAVRHETPLLQCVKANVFYDIIRDLSTIGKIVTIQGSETDKTIKVSSENEFGTKVHHILPIVNGRGHFFSRHVIKYIEKFAKPGLDTEIRLGFGDFLPFTCEWSTGFGYLRMSVAALP